MCMCVVLRMKSKVLHMLGKCSNHWVTFPVFGCFSVFNRVSLCIPDKPKTNGPSASISWGIGVTSAYHHTQIYLHSFYPMQKYSFSFRITGYSGKGVVWTSSSPPLPPLTVTLGSSKARARDPGAGRERVTECERILQNQDHLCWLQSSVMPVI